MLCCIVSHRLDLLLHQSLLAAKVGVETLPRQKQGVIGMTTAELAKVNIMLVHKFEPQVTEWRWRVWHCVSLMPIAAASDLFRLTHLRASAHAPAS